MPPVPETNQPDALDEALKAVKQQMPPNGAAAPMPPLPGPMAPTPADPAAAGTDDDDDDDDKQGEAMKARQAADEIIQFSRHVLAPTLAPLVEEAVKAAFADGFKPLRMELTALRRENESLKGLIQTQGQLAAAMGERLKSISGNPTGGANAVPFGQATAGTAPDPRRPNPAVDFLSIPEAEVQKAVDAGVITFDQSDYIKAGVLPPNFSGREITNIFPGNRFKGVEG